MLQQPGHGGGFADVARPLKQAGLSGKQLLPPAGGPLHPRDQIISTQNRKAHAYTVTHSGEFCLQLETLALRNFVVHKDANSAGMEV